MLKRKTGPWGAIFVAQPIAEHIGAEWVRLDRQQDYAGQTMNRTDRCPSRDRQRLFRATMRTMAGRITLPRHVLDLAALVDPLS